MEILKAIGKRENGDIVEFEVVNGYVDCRYNDLTELHLPDGVKYVWCSYNKLTELHLPDGVKNVWCSNNKLTELHLLDGMKKVDCSYNNFVNNESYFVNPQTDRVIIKQGDKYSCGCYCMKTKEEFYEICKDKGFFEVIEHFKLNS
jgi:hypothetical protein